MRRIVYSTLLFLLLSFSAVAQNGGINFQGMARNAAGEALANQKISLRLSVLLNSESGSVEYSETKEASTSGQGIFSVVVGDGNILTKTGNFSDINWKNSPKFLKVEMDPSGGTNFALLGTSRLQAVPFAYYANGVDAENIQGTLPVAKGGTGVGSITALKTSLGIDQVNNTADANKPVSTATQTALNTKVDKVTGKELSSNDFTTAEKTKLAAISGTNTGDQDLSGLATTAALAGKVDKVTGKELSSNDFTTAEKTKLAAISGTNTGDQDLSGLATTAALATKANTSDVTASLATKVDKVTGKELSTNDYSTAEKTKLAAITGTNTGDQDLSGLATTAALAGKVDKVTGKELSSNDYTTAEKTKLAAISGTNTGDQDLSGLATTAALATKANTSDVTMGLAGKVDKVTGKELSSNDYSTAEKTKLAAITGTNTGDQTTITGNAGTASKLATPKNINGIPFDGSNDINVPAAAGTLTGTTLNSTVTGSSLTSIGTLANLTVTNPIVGSITGNSATATSATTAGNITATSNTTLTTLSSLTSIGTLANLTVTNPIVGSITGNAATATSATTAGNITATSNTTLTTLSSLTSVGTLTSATVTGKVIVGASSAASASAVLEANSTTQGFLPPRMTGAQRDAISSKVAGLVVWCTNCGQNGELQVYNGTAWTNLIGATAAAVYTPTIGEAYQGGKVAYVLVSGDPGYDANTPHGLIAAPTDLRGIIWYNGSYTTTGTSATAIGTGLSNTNAIISSQGNSGSYAAKLCADYSVIVGGVTYDDWYLPSRSELNKLYINRVAIGGFSNYYYWSSTEFSRNSEAYTQYFSDGFFYASDKMYPNDVRAIRAF